MGEQEQHVAVQSRVRARLVLSLVGAGLVVVLAIVGVVALIGRDSDEPERDAVAVADEVTSTTTEVSTTISTEVPVTTVPETAPPASPAPPVVSPTTTAPRSAQAGAAAPNLAPAPTPTTLDPAVWQRAYDACMARQKAITDQQQATLDADIRALTSTVGSIPPEQQAVFSARQAQIDQNIAMAPAFCRNQAQFG